MDQIILIDKPIRMTSFGVVARIRRVLSEKAGKKVKVGHTGTLDPFATGLMILVTGKMCRQAEKFSKLDKVYEADIILGKTSSTGDPEGEISQVSDVRPNLREVEQACAKFVGKIWQTPPIYSAIKIGGERAYKLARKGETPDMPGRQVEVFSLEVEDYNYPVLKIKAHVSSGTYIRTLAEDIGQELGVGAYTSRLRRTKIADYDLEDAKRLEDYGVF